MLKCYDLFDKLPDLLGLHFYPVYFRHGLRLTPFAHPDAGADLDGAVGKRFGELLLKLLELEAFFTNIYLHSVTITLQVCSL